MDLNDLLTKRNIDPEHVLVLRHRPPELPLQEALPWLAADRPENYNAYQQSPRSVLVEAKMLKAEYIASFIGLTPGRAIFVGLYRNTGSHVLSSEQYCQHPLKQEQYRIAEKDIFAYARPGIRWFDLQLMDDYQDWKGKLEVVWPGTDRAWHRWAKSNQFRIHAIHPDSILTPALPEWDTLVLSWEQLQVIPTVWQTHLSQWRCIYYIFDKGTGKGYVGSAYGHDNLLSRWKGYAASGHGGNVLLRRLDHKNFEFSILQRVSQDAAAEDVIQVENSWKTRLHARQPYGLSDN